MRNTWLVVSLIVGCGPWGGGYTVAVGSSGRIGASHCRIPSGEQPPSVTIHEDNYYTAVHPGRTHVVCDSAAYDFDVRQAARIALSSIREDEGYVRVELHAYDAEGRELTLQDGTHVTWDTAEDMFEARPHGDIIPVFDPSVVRTLRPTHAGDHRVTARFDGLEQAVDLDHCAGRTDA